MYENFLDQLDEIQNSLKKPLQFHLMIPNEKAL